MPMHRKNNSAGCPRIPGRKGDETLSFTSRVTQDRRRNKAARIARRVSRGR